MVVVVVSRLSRFFGGSRRRGQNHYLKTCFLRFSLSNAEIRGVRTAIDLEPRVRLHQDHREELRRKLLPILPKIIKNLKLENEITSWALCSVGLSACTVQPNSASISAVTDNFGSFLWSLYWGCGCCELDIRGDEPQQDAWSQLTDRDRPTQLHARLICFGFVVNGVYYYSVLWSVRLPILTSQFCNQKDCRLCRRDFRQDQGDSGENLM